MLPISRILVPTDFSDRCRGILPYVKALAQKHGSEVILLHAVDPFYTIPPTGFSAAVVIPVSSSVIAEREKLLDEFGTSDLEGLKVQRYVQKGDAAIEISAVAQTESVSLIAMPTRGYGALRLLLLGSVTSKVLHDAACPVLTGTHAEDRPATRAVRFSSVLCAIDLGPQSEDVLTWARLFAADFKASLTIVHSIASLDSGFPYAPSLAVRTELEAAARREIERLQIATKTESAPSHILGGEPAAAVSALAESSGADLLVIGRGPTDPDSPPFSGARLPRNAYAIIRQSPCAVLSL
jgi:nucleotide-binding universal stress UspA family protein